MKLRAVLLPGLLVMLLTLLQIRREPQHCTPHPIAAPALRARGALDPIFSTDPLILNLEVDGLSDRKEDDALVGTPTELDAHFLTVTVTSPGETLTRVINLEPRFWRRSTGLVEIIPLGDLNRYRLPVTFPRPNEDVLFFRLRIGFREPA